MPKQPTKPSMPAVNPLGEDADLGSARHRACGPARAALARTGELSRRLDAHAAEDDEQVRALRDDIGEVRGEVRAVNDHVGDLRVDVAKTLSVVDNISATLADQREIKHVRMIAEVETGKAAVIAGIEDEADRKKARRAFWLKVGVVVVGLVGAVAGMLIEHYR